MSIKLIGTAKLLRRFDKYDKDIQKEIKIVLEDVADKIENDAQLNAPDRRANMEVSLAQNIGKYSEDAGRRWRIEVNSQALPFGAYIEFGTGQHAASYLPSLPPEWQAVARTFYVNGKGTLRHTPYLYPAYFKHSPQLIKELKLVIKKTKL